MDENLNDNAAIESLSRQLYKAHIMQVLESKNPDAVEAFVDEKIGLKVSGVEEGTYKKVSLDVCQLISAFNVQHNMKDGEAVSYFFDALMDENDTKLGEEECLQIVQKQVDIPTGAILENFGYEKNGGYKVFIARFSHEENGIPVEKDFIHVLLNGRTGKLISVVRKWHDIDLSYNER